MSQTFLSNGRMLLSFISIFQHYYPSLALSKNSHRQPPDFSIFAEEKPAEITMLHREQLSMAAPYGLRLPCLAPPSPLKPIGQIISDPFHVAHKIPVGDTPYVKAKRVQLVEKDPERAIALFWAAINAGDRVDSALKDMAIVMKQQNRTEEAIEAIKSLRSRCSDQSQESLDNILLDLYKGLAFNGKRTKTARSQGRKFQVSIEQEATRLLGNLGWALMQKDNYVDAEAAYREALMIGPDNNKMCNLGICLMKQGRVAEANVTLKQVSPATPGDGFCGGDSHLKAFDRAQEMLHGLETKMENNPVKGCGWVNQARIFDALQGTSSIWRPQPCIDNHLSHESFADENAHNSSNRNALNVCAPPFYSMSRTVSDSGVCDGLGKLKRTRSRFLTEKVEVGQELPELPEDDEFQQAMIAGALASVLEDGCAKNNDFKSSAEGKMGKRLRIFRDITKTLNVTNGVRM
ncbi:hypothetical protein KSP40_PGU004844 [Platanthera guangdongensis]|uniref:Uncharacterized protein n=1 Tax=Platanthera guangdongensis TaxID=2320717 RepID=A0ABR2MG30_9ASPA